ncbi:hypothetical protein C6341_g12238 [Phytophthora cactorum]|nr:hypothetical protein C6341_g12238 [Phytophthora cactorum]
MLDCLTRLAERMERLEASQEPTEREAAPQWPRCQRVRPFTWTGEGDGSPGPGPDATTRQLVGGAAGHVLRHDAARVRERKRGDGTGAATGVTTALRGTSHQYRHHLAQAMRECLTRGSASSGFVRSTARSSRMVWREVSCSGGKCFVRQIQFAERASGFKWTEDVKTDIPGHHLTGMAERYYNQQVEGWWEEQPALEHAMQRLLHLFSTKITPAQSIKMFTAPKSAKRSCTEHYLYLVALRSWSILHSRPRSSCLARDVVNDVHDGRIDNRKCFMCGKPGHLKATCPNKKQKWGEGGDADFVLTVDDSTIKEGGYVKTNSMAIMYGTGKNG